MISHRKKIYAAAKLLGAACLLSQLVGCQAARSSLDVLSLKKKVPPYEEMKQPEKLPDAAAQPPVPGPDLAAQESVPPPPPAVPALFVGDIVQDREFVGRRKEVFGAWKEKWRELAESFAVYDYPMPEKGRWEECYGLLNAVHAGYTSLNAMLAEGVELPENNPAEPFVVFQQDIVFYEKECQSVFSVAASALPGQMDKYRDIVSRQGEDVLRYRDQQGDTAGVISAFENMRAASPGGATSLEARRIYGKALKSAGRIGESAEVLLDAAGSMNDLEGWPLRITAADMFFALGEYEKARSQYRYVAGLFSSLKKEEGNIAQKMTLLEGQGVHERELDLFRQALLGWLIFDGRQLSPQLVEGVQRLEQEFPGSDYAAAARSLLDGLGATVTGDTDMVLKRAKELADEKKYGEALDLLAPLPQGELSDDKARVVQELAEEIKSRDAEEASKQETERRAALDKKWNDAVALLDQLKFDQAIGLFGELAGEEQYRVAAGQKISEATNLAAAELRKDAASLFVKSRNVANPEQKGKLLMESRRLLLRIMEQYPQADIIGKVKQNLSAIEDQLRILNPALLE